MALSSAEATPVRTASPDNASTADQQPAPLTVVGKGLRMRYKAPRSGSSGERSLLGRLTGRRRMVSVAAVRGIDIAVRQGEFVGIIGRNGSGKSTLLRMLAGVEAPSSGTVLTSAVPMLLGVNAALIPDLTGAENIRLGGLAQGLSPSEVEERFAEVVELSALGDAIDLPMRTYSSGMGSRLKFAISLMKEPEILMIDEALSTGDATFAERSRAAMERLLDRTGTVFLVNHAAQTIEEMCSRAVWLERGQVVLDGDAVEVARKYRWFAHNLAQGEEDVAAGLLRDAIAEGEAARRERAAASEPAADESATGVSGQVERRRDDEFEPDPFHRSLMRREAERKAFPGARADRPEASPGGRGED